MKKPVDAEECYNIADGLYNQGDYQKALEYFLDSFRLEPMAGVACDIAHTHKKLNNLDSAKEYFQVAIDMRLKTLDQYKNTPEFEDKRIEITHRLAATYFEMACIQNDLGNLDAALECFEVALDMRIQELDKCKNTSEFEAKSSEIIPEIVDICAKMACIHEDLGNFTEELYYYDKILEIVPNDNDTISHKMGLCLKLGMRERDLGNIEKAKHYFKEIISCGELISDNVPNEGLYFFTKAVSFAYLGRYDKATECYQELYKLVQSGQLVGDGIQRALNFIRDNLATEWLRIAQEEQLSISINHNEDYKTEQETDIRVMKNALSRLQQKICELEKDVQDSGIKELAKIYRSLKELEEDPAKAEQFEYANKFYWLLTAYFEAYKVLGTDLVQGNFEATQTTKEKALQTVSVALVKKGLQLGQKVAEGIPLVGSIIGLVDVVIDDICKTIKENAFNRKVKIVNKVFERFFKSNSEVEKKLLELAVGLADARAEELASASSNIDKPLSRLEQIISSVKNKLLPGVNIKTGIGEELAIRDVTFLLVSLYTNFEEILVQKKGTISQVFSTIILEGKLPDMKPQDVEEKAPDVPEYMRDPVVETIKTNEKPVTKVAISKTAKKDCAVMSCHKIVLHNNPFADQNPFVNSKAYKEAQRIYDEETVRKLVAFADTLPYDIIIAVCCTDDGLNFLVESMLMGCSDMSLVSDF